MGVTVMNAMNNVLEPPRLKCASRCASRGESQAHMSRCLSPRSLYQARAV